MLQSKAMSFSVEVLSNAAQVEPGSTATGGVTVTNLSDRPVEFELVVEGLDADWTAVPVPLFELEPGKSRTESFFLKPPRTPESASGSYPYVMAVRSMETGETKRVPGVLEVKPFHHITVDFSPRRVLVGYKSSATADVTVANLGNSEHRVQMHATDHDDLFVFEFDSDQAALGPGQQKNMAVTLRATQPALLSNPRLSPFSVSARSLDVTAVGASAQGQAEQKALVSPVTFMGVLLLIILGSVWLMFLPKPPRLNVFSVSQSTVMLGDSVVVSWSSQDASHVSLTVGSEPARRELPNGELTLTPTEAGPLDIRAVAVRDGRESPVSFRQVTVKAQPKAPLPVIEKFEVSPRKIRLGEGIQVTYKLSSSVTQAVLEPFTPTLDPRSTTFQTTPSVVGETTIKLIARNADGVPVEKSIKISVTDESRAKITLFRADPKEVDPAQGETVRITWNLEGAYRAELKVGDQATAITAATGTQEALISADTTLVLTAWDAESRPVTQTIKVTVKKPAPEPAPVEPASGAASGPGPTPPPGPGP
jgi:hypothetical protein